MVGSSGSGKSTLMKVLSGIYKPSSYDGDVYLNDKLCNFNSISESEAAGLVIINQELALVPELSVYENIYLGHEITNRGVISWNEVLKQRPGDETVKVLITLEKKKLK